MEQTRSIDLKKKRPPFSSLPVNTTRARDHFITIPALFSLEINAHSLTYLVALVAEGSLTEDALQISLLNSQMCESTFRTARSMSGPFSSVVNFSVNQFLQRVEKLAILQSIKHSSTMNQNNLTFPKHHKLSHRTHSCVSSSTTVSTLTEPLIEEIVFRAYSQATEVLSSCGFSILNLNREMITFDEVNRLARTKLSRSKCKISNSQSSDDDMEEQSDSDEEDQADEIDGVNGWEDGNEENDQDYDHLDDEDNSNEYPHSMGLNEADHGVIPNVSSSVIHGMRIFDSIDDHQCESFFKIEINGQMKYLHKQTATWYFSKNKPTLSSDRLKRVQSR